MAVMEASSYDAAGQLLSDQTFEQTNDAVVIVDARAPHLPIVAANRACHAALPAASPAPLGRPWSAIFPEAATLGLASAIRHVIATGEPCAIAGLAFGATALAARHAASGPASWDWHCHPLVADDGRITRAAIITAGGGRDRHAARPPTAARLADPSPLGFALLRGPQHIIASANEHLGAILGRAAGTLIGAPLLQTYPALARTPLPDLLAAAARTADAVVLDALALPGAQEPPARWSLRLLPTSHADGCPDGLLLLVRDSTPQRHATPTTHQMAEPPDARQCAAELATVLSAADDGLFILDSAGRVSAANEAGRALFALPERVQGRPFGELLRPPEVRRADEQALDPARDLLAPLLAGRTVSALLLLVARGGDERIVRLTGKPTRDDAGALLGAVLLARDATAQGRAEQEQDAFLSLISHEIRSPLTAIKGFAQLATRALESLGAEAERAKRHLAVIDQQTERIGHLIGDLSDVSRLQRGALALDPVPFDLVPVVRGTVARQRAATTAHEIELTTPDEALIVRADPARIAQALTNLLANAAKYSADGAPIAVALQRQGDSAALTVSDRGSGIAPEEQPHIFERFYRAANGGSGLGLGLFIVHQIVVRSGGTIAVESAEGQGADFRLTLPLAHPEDGEDA